MGKIVVNTNSLNSYASRLASLNIKLAAIHQRLKVISVFSGSAELVKLANDKTLTKQCNTLTSCQQYLRNTASRFTNAETKVASYYKTTKQKNTNISVGKTVKTSSGFQTLVQKLCPSNKLENITQLISGESGFWPSGLKDKVSEYEKLFTGNFTLSQTISASVEWLSSLRDDADTLKDYFEWLNDSDVELPYPIQTAFDFIQVLDITNKSVDGVHTYLMGLFNGVTEDMVNGVHNITDAVSAYVDFKTVTSNIVDFGNNLIIKYGLNMVSNWIESISTDTEVSEVYWNTFANSTIEVFNDTVLNVPTLAVAYLPAKGISDIFGYDLQGAYENVSNKKGFAAVVDAFGQMGEIFIENSTWENWKSGMAYIGDEISKFWNGLF